MHDIYIFDFDYTLYKTSETVLVWSPRGDHIVDGKKCFRLLPNLFAQYKISTDEIINEDSFKNFYAIDFDKAMPIKPCLEIFNIVDNKVVLSARPMEASQDFYAKHGHNCQFIGLKNSSSDAKLEVIHKYKNPIVFEDSSFVIEELVKEKIDCVHVITESTMTTNLKYHLF